MAKNSIFEGILSFHLQLKNSSPARFGFFACFSVTSLVQLKAGIVFLKKEISEGTCYVHHCRLPRVQVSFFRKFALPPPPEVLWTGRGGVRFQMGGALAHPLMPRRWSSNMAIFKGKLPWSAGIGAITISLRGMEILQI